MHSSMKLFNLLLASALTLPLAQTANSSQQLVNTISAESSQPKQAEAASDQSDFTQGNLEEGDSVYSNTNRRFDAYSFAGETGETIRMTVTSEAFVPMISLVDETTGDVIRRETGEAGTAILTHELPRDGNYTFLVNATDVPGAGRYQFKIVTVREVPSAATEADRLLSEGQDLARQGQFETAIQAYEQALTLYREMGDRSGEILTLLNLGLAHSAFRQDEQAISFLEPALTLIRAEEAADNEAQLRQRRLEGEALGGLAIAYRELGEYEQAIALFREQIPILQELGDRFEEGRVLGRLGIAYRESEQYEQAIEVLQQRIEIAREIGDRAGEGSGLGNLGLAYDGLGQYEQALEAYKQRIEIARELNQLDRESQTLGNMAETYISLGEIETAVELLEQALEIAREINYTDQESRILERLESLPAFSTSAGSKILSLDGVLDENSEEIALGFDGGEPTSRRPRNTHQIQGVENQNILIHLESDDFVPYIILINSETKDFSSQSLAENTLSGDAWLITTLPSSGIYDVYVTTHNPESSGSYRLTVVEADTASLLLSDASNSYIQASEQYDLENYQEALKLYKQSLDFYQSETVRAAFPELSRRQESFVLGSIGNSYDALGEYGTSIEFQELAIELKREIPDRSSEALSWRNLGNSYFRLGNLEKSTEAYQEALSIWQDIGSLEEQEITLNRLGDTYFQWRKYELAIESYEQLLELRKGKNDPEATIHVLRNLGISSYSLGLYEEAIEFHEQALANAIEVENQLEEASALGNLSNVYERLGNRQRAFELVRQTFEIASEIENDELQVKALYNLAEIYHNLGQYQQAIDLYQETIAVAREAEDSAIEGGALNNLGSLYFDLGKTDEAIELYEQSLDIALETNNRTGVALASRSLSKVHPNPVRARQFLDQSIHISNNLNDRRFLARAWDDLGRWYTNNALADYDAEDETVNISHRYQEAYDAFQQALALYKRLGMREEEGVVLGNIGFLYERTGDHSNAFRHFEQSLEIAREVGNVRGEVDALLKLGSAYWNLTRFTFNEELDPEKLSRINEEVAGLRTAAENILLEVLEILDSLREGDLNDSDKIALFETQQSTYARLQSLLAFQGRYEEALVASERARSRVLVETLSSQTLPQTQQEFFGNAPDLEAILRTARQQNTTLVTYSELNGVIHIWVIQPSGEIIFKSVNTAPTLPRFQLLTSNILRANHDVLRADLGYGLEEIEIGGSSEDPNLNELILDSREVIGVRGADRAGARPQLRPEDIARLQAEQDEKLSQLHDLLIEPIADFLPDDPNQPIVFIPQGELLLVPFPALKDDNGNYLIENHTILTAPSIQVLQLTHDIADSREGATTDKPVIVGNPTMPTVTFLSEAGSFEDMQLSSLFGAQQEAQAVAEFLDAPALIGADATEATVKQQLASADLIHLATHGLLEYGDPRETGTRDVPGAIALTPGGGEDGLLTAAEILQMDLQADLVVLSACDTGRGRITGDGVIGLSRSFIAAGVPSVVVSLWAVPDAPTANLMTEFYRQLDQGQTKAQALRQAMLITMQDHPDPKDWAAFTLIGESE